MSSMTDLPQPEPYGRGTVAAKPIDPDQLVGATEIAERLGVDRKTVHHWRERHEAFPAPVATIERTLVWFWPAIEQWAKATGRL